MRFHVLDAGSPRELADWIRLWSTWPKREIMAHPEYARLFARPCDRVVCAAGEHDGRTILFPLVLRPLAAEAWARPEERRWDAITPYGYGGPFAWGSLARDDDAFWRAHAAWCCEERLVSTFVRLSLFPAEFAPLPWPVEVRMPNVVISLGAGLEAVRHGYDRNARRWIRHAERLGLGVVEDRDGSRLDSFLNVYMHTMFRRRAAEHALRRAFFEALIERLPGQYAFFHAVRRGEVISTELVLCSARRVYSFLGGTLADAFEFGPNFLLKDHIAAWAIAEGKKEYVLGGGYQPGDGVFRYKRSFARDGQVPFQVAAVVHDEHACRELSAERAAFAAREGRAWAPRPGFFPPYRA
jgi:hypothetical protein